MNDPKSQAAAEATAAKTIDIETGPEAGPSDVPKDSAADPAADSARDPEPASGGDAGTSSGAEQAAQPSAERIALLEAEVAELKDKLLRQVAETENVRKRLTRDRDEQIRYAAVPLLRDLLPVVDNLRRALEVAPAAEDPAAEKIKPLLEGLAMTERELMNAFQRHKIEEIAAEGERLDPHLHEAMFEVPDPSKPSGTVVQVVQSGFRLHDRLLRPARVGVAKGGPAPREAANDPAGDKVGSDG